MIHLYISIGNGVTNYFVKLKIRRVQFFTNLNTYPLYSRGPHGLLDILYVYKLPGLLQATNLEKQEKYYQLNKFTICP